MVKAIVLHEYGGPEVLKWEDVEVGDPGPGEVRIRHTAVGLNYRDVYHRNGNYGVAEFPAVIGGDGAGVIEAVGTNVTKFSVGQRVAYGNGLMGSYSQSRLFTTEHLLPLPDGVADETAAAMLVKGFTCYALVKRAYPVKAGDTILIHAVAGGCGLIMCQMAKDLGATVIGTTSTEEKAQLAKSVGCDHVILYTQEDFATRTREITGGEG
ncbi:MAG: quinone oxidoreductase, partial [Alphaproteobacteria bacterium]|nr:quinone oxidoreductase [Alphaproteobacteria bacterium]